MRKRKSKYPGLEETFFHRSCGRCGKTSSYRNVHRVNAPRVIDQVWTCPYCGLVRPTFTREESYETFAPDVAPPPMLEAANIFARVMLDDVRVKP